jgi:hypothetical protein
MLWALRRTDDSIVNESVRGLNVAVVSAYGVPYSQW